jgi:hypothetical protein
MKLTKRQKQIADQPLHCRVEGQRLVISIGLKTLAFAAEHQDDNQKLKIEDEMALGKDVCHELTHEDEIGQSLLTHLFDSATTNACENGSVAFDHDDPIPER